MDKPTKEKDDTASTAPNPSVADPVIHTFAAGSEALLVNSYLVETDSGVVAIDGSLTVSASTALHGLLRKIGKPLLAVLITHGHPDHYNGIANLTANDQVPVKH